MMVAILLLSYGEPAADTISIRRALARKKLLARNAWEYGGLVLIPKPADAFLPRSNSHAHHWGDLIDLRASDNSATPRALSLQLFFGKTKVRLE
jgi:hypothetical protein